MAEICIFFFFFFFLLQCYYCPSQIQPDLGALMHSRCVNSLTSAIPSANSYITKSAAVRGSSNEYDRYGTAGTQEILRRRVTSVIGQDGTSARMLPFVMVTKQHDDLRRIAN